MTRFCPALLALSAASLTASAALAQSTTAAPVVTAAAASASPASPASPASAERGRIEAGVGGASLSDNNRSWRDGYVLGHYKLQPGSTLHWEIASQGHFGQRGTLGALSFTQDLSPLWYLSGGVSAGRADFQNRYRLDAGIHRKWGATQQWVTRLGLMRSASNDDIHKDTALTLAAAYYSPQHWVAEAGVLANHSSPGSVNSYRGFGAFTWGENKKHYLALRLDHGQEAYLPAGAMGGPNQPNVRFNSTELSVQWRQWLTPQLGYTLGVQGYRNSYYNRVGGNVGLFYDF